MRPRFIPLSNQRIEEMEERGLIGPTDNASFYAATGNIDLGLQSRADSEGPSIEWVNAGKYSFLREIASDEELGYRAEREI